MISSLAAIAASATDGPGYFDIPPTPAKLPRHVIRRALHNRPLRAAGLLLASLLAFAAGAPSAYSQTTSPGTIPSTKPTTNPTTSPTTAPAPRTSRDLTLAPELKGRLVEAIRIVGNRQVSANVILNVVRSREGQPFEPQAVEEDYQRIFDLKRFANVEAKVEPTAKGVIIVFIVNEQRQITSIAYKGNKNVSTDSVQEAADIKSGQAIDPFRISLARQAIESLYHTKNFPHAHVSVPQEPLTQKGELIFNIVEGPEVRVRKVDFLGRESFTEDKLLDQVKTRNWIWIFRPGTLDNDQIEDDVASLRKFYNDKGFFDARVGRKVIISPDQTEAQVNFLIEEGQRYVIDHVSFKGNRSVSDAKLHENLKLVEGQPWDSEILARDQREIVRAYSPFGFVYQQGSDNPDYLRIVPRPVFRREAGRVELLYDISEGKPFRLGRIIVSGNSKTQDKVVLREMRVSSGQLYNSSALQEASDRLKSTPYFGGVTMTPIGDDPESRDVLVEVQETKTALFTLGAGINSNGGLGGNVTYEQRNFDITNVPSTPSELFSDKSFTGAGQNLRISLEPGTQQSNASIRFTEPYVFDLPYSFFIEGYARNRFREDYEDTRMGARLGFGKRFDYVHSALLAFRAEDVSIHAIEDPLDRAPEINAGEGHSTLTSVALSFRRNTTNGGAMPYRGTDSSIGVEQFGALGGNLYFSKFTASTDIYQTIHEDLLDRKWVMIYRADTAFIQPDAPFYERLYGGGFGSIRGFSFRGVTPRAGRFDDRVGGIFSLTGTAELSYPIAGDILRGVVFTDAGTVRSDFELGTIRTSIGAGIRLFLPLPGLSQAPLAIDFAVPLSKDDADDTQLISFSFGFFQ